MKKEIYDLSRTRDKKGEIVKRTLKNHVNCLHASCGGGYETMLILVVEIYEEDNSGISSRQGENRGREKA